MRARRGTGCSRDRGSICRFHSARRMMPSTPPTGRHHRNSEGRQTVTASTGRRERPVAGRPLNVRSSARGIHEPDDAVRNRTGRSGANPDCRLVHLGASGAGWETIGTRVPHNPPSSFAEPTARLPPQREPDRHRDRGSWVPTWCRRVRPCRCVRPCATRPMRCRWRAARALTDYSQPGAVVRLSSTGRTLCTTALGRAALNHTSIAIPLASNRIAILRRLQQPDHRGRPATDQ